MSSHSVTTLMPESATNQRVAHAAGICQTKGGCMAGWPEQDCSEEWPDSITTFMTHNLILMKFYF